MADSVVDAPPAESSGPDEPDSAVEAAIAAVYRPFAAAGVEIGEEIEAGVLHTLRAGLERHADAVAAVGLRAAPPEDPDERLERIVEYRRVLMTDLLGPLALEIQGRAPGSVIARRLTETLDDSSDAIRALLEEVDVPWTEDALRPHPSDGRGRRLRRVVARLVSRARHAGRTRPLPLRAVARRHFHSALLPVVESAGHEAVFRWARWTQALADAWIGWADAHLVMVVRAGRKGPAGDEAWLAVADGADMLQERLAGLAAVYPRWTRPEDLEQVVTPPRSRLEADLAVAGSLVYDPPSAGNEDEQVPGIAEVTPALEALATGVANRLELYSAILGMLAATAAIRTRLLSRFEEECLEPVRRLRAVADQFEVLESEVPSGREPEAVWAAMERLMTRVSAAEGRAMELLPDEELVREILVEGAHSMADALGSVLAQAPDEISLVPEGAVLHPRLRRIETRTVPLRQLARQAFDLLRVDRIRGSTGELVAAVDRLHDDVGELSGVLSFAFESARSELGEGPGPDAEQAERVLEAPAEGKEVDHVENASKLVSDALGNVADSLRTEVSELETAFDETRVTLADEVGEGTLGLIERVGAGGVQAQMLAARSGLASAAARTLDRWGPQLRSLHRTWRYVRIRLRRWARRLLRTGRRVVAGASAEGVVSTRMVRLLSEASALVRTLPPVYQRLFSLDALSDTQLLVGRDGLIADAVARWKRLGEGQADCLVLRGRHGAGLTSFLRAVETAVEAERGRTARICPTERVGSESEWVVTLAEALGLPTVDTLDELAQSILAAHSGTLPELVTVDNLEHVFLRIAGGSALVDRTLSLMVRTESRICWIGGMTLAAWQQISTAVPNAVAQVDTMELPPLDAAGIRLAVRTRHRRSGLALRYEEPRGRRLLKRRLRKARKPDAVRSILADDFFDQLVRASSGDLRLALFQWLQCCDFEQGEGLLVHPPTRPDFSVLDSLSLTQAFTLKAFLEHRTLTIEEHDRVFRIPGGESTQIFESLVNRRLLTTLPRGSSSGGDGADGSTRYRIHPLLVGAVTQHLRGRNVLH